MGKVVQSLYASADPRYRSVRRFLRHRYRTSGPYRAHEPEDIARIWNAPERPYQLSVSYEATLIRIDSELFESEAPVAEVDVVYGLIVGESSSNGNANPLPHCIRQ